MHCVTYVKTPGMGLSVCFPSIIPLSETAYWNDCEVYYSTAEREILMWESYSLQTQLIRIVVWISVEGNHSLTAIWS